MIYKGQQEFLNEKIKTEKFFCAYLRIKIWSNFPKVQIRFPKLEKILWRNLILKQLQNGENVFELRRGLQNQGFI